MLHYPSFVYLLGKQVWLFMPIQDILILLGLAQYSIISHLFMFVRSFIYLWMSTCLLVLHLRSIVHSGLSLIPIATTLPYDFQFLLVSNWMVVSNYIWIFWGKGRVWTVFSLVQNINFIWFSLGRKGTFALDWYFSTWCLSRWSVGFIPYSLAKTGGIPDLAK